MPLGSKLFKKSQPDREPIESLLSAPGSLWLRWTPSLWRLSSLQGLSTFHVEPRSHCYGAFLPSECQVPLKASPACSRFPQRDRGLSSTTCPNYPPALFGIFQPGPGSMAFSLSYPSIETTISKERLLSLLVNYFPPLICHRLSDAGVCLGSLGPPSLARGELVLPARCLIFPPAALESLRQIQAKRRAIEGLHFLLCHLAMLISLQDLRRLEQGQALEPEASLL